MATPTSAATLAERRRTRTAREIEEAAAGLFERQGYAATTVDEIAQAAGISLRTFYRYFPTKADAVTSALTGSAELLSEEVRTRTDKPLIDALVEGFIAAIDHEGADRAHRARLMRLNVSTPALRGTWLAAGRAAQEALLPVLSARAPQGDTTTDRALCAAVIAILTQALETWSEHPDKDLRAISRECLELLGPRLGAGPTEARAPHHTVTESA